MNTYTREELINICERAVVPFLEWNNRDSYSSQVQLVDIHRLLIIGAEFEIKIDHETISINFINLTENIKGKYRDIGYELQIDSLEDYFEEFGRDNEMFESNGIDIDCKYGCSGYLPTQKRLEDADGRDYPQGRMNEVNKGY